MSGGKCPWVTDVGSLYHNPNSARAHLTIEQGDAGSRPVHRYCRGVGRGEGLRVLDGHSVVDGVGIEQREPFDQPEGLPPTRAARSG